MIISLLKLTIGLALFRVGPADMPYSLQLTRALAGVAVLTSTLLMSPFLPLPLAIAAGVGGVAGIVFFTQVMLRTCKLETRLLQTLAAQFAVGSLFALVMYPIFLLMAPFVMEMLKNPGMLADVQSGKTPMPTGGLAPLIADVLFFWNLMVSVRINRAAADLSQPLSWLLTLASLFVVMSFVTMAQLLVFPLAH